MEPRYGDLPWAAWPTKRSRLRGLDYGPASLRPSGMTDTGTSTGGSGKPGACGPLPVQAVRRLAFPGDRLHVRRSGPFHGDPRTPRAHQRLGTDRRAAQSARRRRGPRRGARALDAGGKERGRQILRRRRMGSDGRMVSKRARPTRQLPRLMPNPPEAMAFTGKDNPWSALYTLADRVPVAVVTLGSQGAMAVDSLTGEEEWVPSLPVTADDPTGAGDCFGAAFVVGCLAGWPLGDRLRFANLCASLAVQQVGGSLAAPGWGDIADWWQRANARRERQASQWRPVRLPRGPSWRTSRPGARARRHDRPLLRRMSGAHPSQPVGTESTRSPPRY